MSIPCVLRLLANGAANRIRGGDHGDTVLQRHDGTFTRATLDARTHLVRLVVITVARVAIVDAGAATAARPSQSLRKMVDECVLAQASAPTELRFFRTQRRLVGDFQAIGPHDRAPYANHSRGTQYLEIVRRPSADAHEK